MDELLSVIVPAYNVGPYLANCLDSILAQTYLNLEIVIVDDGATDDSAAIATAYMARWPEKIRFFHTENHGVTSARLTGVQAASGTWIGFVDGDDEIEPEMYERLYRNAVQYGADISHCGYKIIQNGGEHIHEFYNTGRLLLQNRLDGVKEILVGKFEPSLCNKLFRAELLRGMLQRGEMDPSIKYNEDLLMNYYLFRGAERSVYEDFCGYHYLIRSDSASRSQFRSQRMLDPVKVRKIILDQVEPELKEPMWGNYLMLCNIAFGAFLRRKGEETNAAAMRSILLAHRDKWHLMRRADRIKLKGRLLSPSLFNRLYRIYEKFFQKKQYE